MTPIESVEIQGGQKGIEVGCKTCSSLIREPFILYQETGEGDELSEPLAETAAMRHDNKFQGHEISIVKGT